MTLKELRAYGRSKHRANRLEQEIEAHMCTDSVLASAPQHPYDLRHMKISGLDSQGVQLAAQRAQLIQRCEEVEKYIASISNEETREMFSQVFIKGRSYTRAALECGMTAEAVRKRIYRYLRRHGR